MLEEYDFRVGDWGFLGQGSVVCCGSLIVSALARRQRNNYKDAQEQNGYCGSAMLHDRSLLSVHG